MLKKVSKQNICLKSAHDLSSPPVSSAPNHQDKGSRVLVCQSPHSTLCRVVLSICQSLYPFTEQLLSLLETPDLQIVSWVVKAIVEVCTSHQGVISTLHGVGVLWEVGWGNFAGRFLSLSETLPFFKL